MLNKLEIEMYDSKLYASLVEAVNENAVANFELHGSYANAESVELIDTLRALSACTSMTAPVIVLFNDDKFVNTFHSINNTSF